ncbi:MAG TPA: L,D-transpeptidase [Solirubrobacteraceae bacterium]|jgi:hypothetical protein|nr:L,D-transpeptidase [Solirubrobacteraceae bacterium]
MARIARGAFALTLLTLLAPVRASAAAAPADTTPTTPPPVTTTPATPVPPAVPAPVDGHLRVALDRVFAVHRQDVTVTGQVLHINGVATPYVPGQVITVEVRRGRRLLKSETLRLRPSASGGDGRFSMRFSSPASGRLSITAVHAATAQQMRFAAAAKKLDVVVPRAGPGARGLFVSLIQSRLAALHYAVPRDGVYDQLTASAVLAYRKVRGWNRIYSLDSGVVRGLLEGSGTFQVRYPNQGRHVEADLTDQTLALINGSKVYAIYPISSGKPSTPTILGTYHVYERTPGYLPDGMYFSSFFIRGYAIHGYDPAPTYPASHGCLRLPIGDAIAVYNWIQYGTTVDVYYGAN